MNHLIVLLYGERKEVLTENLQNLKHPSKRTDLLFWLLTHTDDITATTHWIDIHLPLYAPGDKAVNSDSSSLQAIPLLVDLCFHSDAA